MSRKKYKKPTENKRSKTLHQIASENIRQTMVAVYVFIMLCIFPLYYDPGEHGRYFNMGATKYNMFRTTSLVMLGLILAAFVYQYLAGRKAAGGRPERHRLSEADIAALLFLAVSMLSYIFSSYKDVALWGYKGWYMGAVSQIIFVASFFAASRGWNWSPVTLLCMTVSAAVCYQIGILQRFCFNPLHLYDHVGVEDIEKFLSTLGQTSWYSSYAVLVIPFGMYFYLSAERRYSYLISGCFLALAFGMLCTTNSDSAYVAIVLILMVFFRYSLESNARMRRFLEMVLIALASFRIIGWMHELYPERQRTYITGDEKITKFITSSPFMLVALILAAAVYVAFRVAASEAKEGEESCARRPLDISKYREPVWRITVAAAVLVIWGVLMMVLLVSTGKVRFGDETSFFYFSESWGNHRGFNWRMAARAITHASWKDLLVGVGPDCFDGAMDRYCAEEVAVYWHGLALACAHNEWLNMLVTEGVLGVAAYIGIFITMFARASARVGEEPVLMAFMAAIAAYIGHNIFCYQQSVCTPVIFILMGITEMICRAVGKEKGK